VYKFWRSALLGLGLISPKFFSAQESQKSYKYQNGKYLYTETAAGLEEPVSLRLLTLEEYLAEKLLENRTDYFSRKLRGTKLKAQEAEEQATDLLKLQFGLGVRGEFFYRMFGSNQIQIKPKGTAELSLGVSSNQVDNPAIPVDNRRQTFFDFNFRSNISMIGNVGRKLNMRVNYNTEANFDYENDIKIEYTGDADQIIQKIEVGNVSFPLQSTLISGVSSLFGGKIITQWGGLRATALASAQRSENKSITVKSGSTYQEIAFKADEYEENRFFFTSLYFREQYDKDMRFLPSLPPGAKINKIEVWVTNTTQKFENTRQIIALTDLGENPTFRADAVFPYQRYTQRIFNSIPLSAQALPDNQNNALYANLSVQSALRNIKNAENILNFPQGFFVDGKGMEKGIDYETIENARLLSPGEFKFNARLGYISLSSKLKPTDVLALAYEYTDAQGNVHKVGELSTDGFGSEQALLVKLVKSTFINKDVTIFHLMLKNVYTLRTYKISSQDFKLDVLFRNAQTGVDVNFIAETGLQDYILSQLLGFDRLNQNGSPYPDGLYDFIDGAETQAGTIESAKGLVFLPSVEPFGTNLAGGIAKTLQKQGYDDVYIQSVIDKVAYTQLYNLPQSQAAQLLDKNIFKLKASYQSENSSEIILDALNVPQGSVRVTAGGLKLVEGVDYSVNYTLGRVKILNEALLQAGTPIKIDFENNTLLNLQQKSLFGVQLDYDWQKKLSAGFTYLNANQQPISKKTNIGAEPYSNHVLGLQFRYQDELPFLANWLDRIPFLYTKEPSKFWVNGEFAHFIPTSPNTYGKGGLAYLDNFESTQSVVELKSVQAWKLASVPSAYPEFQEIDPTQTGKNRANLAWYVIDPVFTDNSAKTPAYLQNNKELQGALYSRAVYAGEIFPAREFQTGVPTQIPTFDLYYDPKERGMYNLDAKALEADGTLSNPQSRWGGIMRALPVNNFEQSNVEYVQIWLLNPYEEEAKKAGHDGKGKLYLQLGEISEEILKGTASFNESLLPSDQNIALSQIELKDWGRSPDKLALVYQFQGQGKERVFQDAGLNGIVSEVERAFYASYITQVQSTVTDAARLQKIIDDPAGDNYISSLSNVWDADRTEIYKRYKYFNGTEGNSSDDNPATNIPDGNDLNQDFNTNKTERYFEYEINLDPAQMQVGKNFIVSEIDTDLSDAYATSPSAKWYLLRIPLTEFSKNVGNLPDFRTMRFARMILKDFDKPIVLRMAKFELLRGEWRAMQQPLDISTQQVGTTFEVSAVNLEENGTRLPVNYVVPPGVERDIQFAGEQVLKQNEQSLELTVKKLKDGDARAAYKAVSNDLLSYGKLEMFVHAEPILNENLQDDDLHLFLRLGSDFNENYYQYEMPLKITQIGSGFVSDPYQIWRVENNISLVLADLQELKKERNSQNAPLSENYTKLLEAGKKISIKGNPNLQSLRTLLIGVRNPRTGGKEHSAVIWVDELRLVDFKQSGGWASTVQAHLDVSDLAQFDVSGSMSTPGWGALDSRVSDRQRDTKQAFETSTLLQLGKMMGQRVVVRMPLFASHSQTWSLPQYDPKTGDLLSSDLSKSEQNRIASVRWRTSVNLSSVGVEPIFKKKNVFYDPGNLRFSWAYSEERFRDIFVSEDRLKYFQLGMQYNFAHTAKMWQPFLKNKTAQSAWGKILQDFQIGLSPNVLYFSSDLRRNYQQKQFKPVFQNEMPWQINKRFLWDRNYKISYNLTKNLRVNFSARNQSLVQEPDTITDKKLFPELYKQVQDSIWRSLSKLGTNIDYTHNLEIDYTLPFDNFPLLDWTKTTLNYKAGVQWQRMPFIKYQAGLPVNAGNYQENDFVKPQDYLGNTLQNNRVVNFSTTLDFSKLYFKSTKLRDSEKRLKRLEAQNANTKAPSSAQLAGDYVIRFLTMLRKVNFDYTIKDVTTIPGYTGNMSILGFDNSFKAPGFGFLFGAQERDIFGKLKNAENTPIYQLQAAGFLIESALVNDPYKVSRTTDWKLRAQLEPFPHFFIDLGMEQKSTQTHSIFYRYNSGLSQYETVNPSLSGAYSISFNTIATSFNRGGTFQKFLDARKEMSSILGEVYGESPDGNGYYTGFSKNQEQVLSSAFLSAYSGQKTKNQNILSAFPLPAWRASYTGLTKFAPVRKIFRNISINHEYSSTYSVNNYNTLLAQNNQSLYNPNGDRLVFDKGLIMQYNTLVLSEKFSPLIEVSVDLQKNWQFRIGYNKDRNLALSLQNQQLTEQQGGQYNGSVGYKFPNILFPFQGKRLNSELQLRTDVSVRQNQTWVHRLSTEETQITAGSQVLTVRFNADYAISQTVYFILFFEHIWNKPSTSTSYNSHNTKGGITMRLSFN
jgi:cell surface protein SprA